MRGFKGSGLARPNDAPLGICDRVLFAPIGDQPNNSTFYQLRIGSQQ